jgi:hypothetical protein
MKIEETGLHILPSITPSILALVLHLHHHSVHC